MQLVLSFYSMEANMELLFRLFYSGEQNVPRIGERYIYRDMENNKIYDILIKDMLWVNNKGIYDFESSIEILYTVDDRHGQI